jgi:hypothetical protein
MNFCPRRNIRGFYSGGYEWCHLLGYSAVKKRFGATYHLHLQDRKSAEQETNVQQVARQNRLIFYPEDGSDTFLRNVGSHTDYTALFPRIWQHFCPGSFLFFHCRV